MNNYCKMCRLKDGCIQKCKEAEIYEKGYNDAYIEVGKIIRACKEIKRNNAQLEHQKEFKNYGGQI